MIQVFGLDLRDRDRSWFGRPKISATAAMSSWATRSWRRSWRRPRSPIGAVVVAGDLVDGWGDFAWAGLECVHINRDVYYSQNQQTMGHDNNDKGYVLCILYIFMTIYYQLSGVITLKTLALFELGSFNMGGTPLNMLQGHGCPLNLEFKEFLRKFCSIKKHTKNQKE